MTAARPGERAEVWFGDEARFGQKGTLTTVWAERGSRPTAPKQGAFGNLHVLAAVCPATGEAEGSVSPALNAEVEQHAQDYERLADLGVRLGALAEEREALELEWLEAAEQLDG